MVCVRAHTSTYMCVFRVIMAKKERMQEHCENHTVSEEAEESCRRKHDVFAN